MRRLSAQVKQLRNNPPPEYFLQLYFMGHKWWHPPNQKEQPEETLPESTLPEFED